MRTRIMWLDAQSIFYLPLLSHSFMHPQKFKTNLYTQYTQRYISTTLFLLNWWLFYYYQSIYFWIWTRCKTRKFRTNISIKFKKDNHVNVFKTGQDFNFRKVLSKHKNIRCLIRRKFEVKKNLLRCTFR